jgi:hypothetical protein
VARDRITSGYISARTSAPCAAASSETASLASVAARPVARGISTFQLSGRAAARAIAVMVAEWTGSNAWVVGTNSSWVPAWSRHTAARATSSSGVAARDGTGAPSPSTWVGAHDDENPSPPAASASASSARMRSISASVAARSVPARRTARRRAEWPTITPTFTAGAAAATASRYSANVRQLHGTPAASVARGMPSTRASMRIR